MFSLVTTWLHEHLYGVVLLGAVVDAIGIPFPGRLMLITVGSFSDGTTRLPIVIALATIGTVAGDHVWYLVGRLGGRRLFRAYARLLRLSESHAATADRLLRRFGGLALILCRMAATVRIAILPLAVSRGMSYRRFVLLDTLGAFLWAAGFVWLGRVAATLASGSSGPIGVLAVVGTLGIASAVASVLVRRPRPVSAPCSE